MKLSTTQNALHFLHDSSSVDLEHGQQFGGFAAPRHRPHSQSVDHDAGVSAQGARNSFAETA